MNSLNWLESISGKTQATDTRETSAGGSQLIDLGLVAESTKAMIPSGVVLDGGMIPRGPLYQLYE
jgi:hypothetical protein